VQNFDPNAIKAHVFLFTESNKLWLSPCKEKNAFEINRVFEVWFWYKWQRLRSCLF